MEDTLTFVMAGGQGERLRPLTDVRAKPAVPFGGIFRIIDFTLSNCVNSGLRRIYVLTQYKSYSLSSHLKTGWNMFSARLDQFIDEVPAQQKLGSSWYQGTADAIRQNANFIESKRPRLVLVLSGDHVYKMDYRLLRALHDEKHAGLTVACVRMPAEEAAGNFGVMEVDEEGRIVGFEEKPTEPKTIPGTSDCLASMGIYLFEADSLRKGLDNDLLDFGKDVIPMLLRKGTAVFAYDFTQRNNIPEWEFLKYEGTRRKELVPRGSDSDYWRDVGTLEQYWLANLDLVQPRPKFNVYGEHFPLFSAPGHFPPAKFVHEMPGRTGVAVNSIVADGVIVSGATVRESVLGCGVYVHSWAMVERSVLLGGELRGGILTETSIGRRCRVRNAIIDKNVQLSENTSIGYDRADDDRRGLKTVSITGSNDYIVVVPKDFAL
ncbi:MAG TPA: glucose-1-phosphate adenylyltransferase [Thermoanaerobaculia bacterium]|nr:glucose-1-phosphate adenylyltransferase [Thermoanaerobaculia bacterium]